ncbi:MAG: right-handed parallel beta-helix repeat-containing protein, partial [Candidatus Thermoplasmatota archaeon]|nr:right-handed parallel beta-helix repeat-containing protein [Candidatus Thermoplasmatota archaeon]
MRASLKEASVLSVLFLFVASSCAFYVSSHPGEKDVGPAHSLVLTPHDPILILGDGDFTLANGVTSGTGTPGDPYVIEGWEINASAENGIEIQDTRADFTIRNVYVHGGRDAIFNGIELYNVRNGCIQNSTISDNYRGIYSWFALADFKIAENNVTGNMMGVDLRDSTTVNVSGNNISGNWYGIYFSGTGSTISGNAISVSNGSSIYAYGSDRIIITNNTVSNSRGGAYLSGCTRTNFSVNLLLAPCDGLFISDSTGLALSSNVIVQTGLEIGGDN